MLILSNLVRPYLDEILVEAVIATIPASNAVHKTSSRDVNIGADKARPRLGRGWTRAEKVALSLLCQSGIRFVPSQVGQASPLEYKGAHSGESIGLRAIVAAIGEDQVVVRDTGASVESVAQIIRQIECLLQEGVDFARLLIISFLSIKETGKY